jgi:hypothetical protein
MKTDYMNDWGISVEEICKEAKPYPALDLNNLEDIKVRLSSDNGEFMSTGMMEHCTSESGNILVNIAFDEPLPHNMKWSPSDPFSQKVISFDVKEVYRLISEMIADKMLTPKRQLQNIKIHK